MALDKDVDSITEADLQALVDAQVPEGLYIEYKGELNIGTGDEKREFINDVSSFANASGGHLIFGIPAKQGIPQTLEGLVLTDPDSVTLQVEQLIRSCIDPRIPSLRVRPIKLANDRYCMIIRVGQSWMRPHMASLGSPKFFARSSAGKVPLNATEIRNAFTASDAIQNRLHQFHLNRLAEVVADKTSPFKLGDGPKTILHLIPLTSADASVRYDIAKVVDEVRRRDHMFLPSIGSSHERYNLEGYQSYCLTGDGFNTGYTQVFRNGTIEGVENYILGALLGEGEKKIAIIMYEDRLLKALPILLAQQKALGVEPPVLLKVTLTGLSGFMIETHRAGVHAPWYKPENYMITQDPLILPEVIIDSFDAKPDKVLQPMLDAFWNASGFPKCPQYDADGNWIQPRR